MALLDHLVNAFVLTCEKVLFEKDDVISLIRLVDVFYAPRGKVQPTNTVENCPAIGMAVVAAVKFDPTAADGTKHQFSLKLVRPSGEEKDILQGPAEFELTTSPKHPMAPVGFNGLFSPVMVVPKQLGQHRLIAFIDGQEVCQTIFTLAEVEEPKL